MAELILCKVKKAFSLYKPGDLVKFSAEDLKKFKDNVELVQDNKKAPKGSIKALLVGALLAGFSAASMAGDYTVSAGTFPVTEAHTIAAQIAGAAKIVKLDVFSTGEAAQVVTVYKDCGSTTTVAAVYQLTLGKSSYEVNSSSTISLGQDFQKLEWPDYNSPLTLSNVCFRKSSTASTVYVNVKYR